MSKIRRGGKWVATTVGESLVGLGVQIVIGLVGGAAVLAGLLKLIFKMRGVSLDWYITGAIFLGGLALIILSVILTRRKGEKASLEETPATPAPASTDERREAKPRPELWFEIDEAESQVRVADAMTHEIRAINADIKVRCFKEADRVMDVRGFHLSLHRTQADGREITVIDHEDGALGWRYPNMQTVRTKDVWRIDEPSTEYRIFHFTLGVTPKIQFSLSDDYFLRVTMDAVGQEPLSQTVYVEDWHVENSGFSPVRLKPREEFPLAAQKEIHRLRDALRSSEKTNEQLGEHYKKYEKVIALADRQAGEIEKYVVLDKVIVGSMDLMSAVPSVRFGVYVTNNSVFHISLDYEEKAEVKGLISFEDFEYIELNRPKVTLNSVRNLAPGQPGSLTIKQLLTPEQATAIYNAKISEQAKFGFDDLIINIIGGKDSTDVTSAQLKIKNTFVAPFPVDPKKRVNKVKALSQVWGRCVQLHEPLRIGDEPISKSVIENWHSGALFILEREGYTADEAKRLMQQVTHDDDFPETSASSQRNWVHFCIVMLEDFITKEIALVHLNAEPRQLTHQELLDRIQTLPVAKRPEAYKAYGRLLEQQLTEYQASKASEEAKKNNSRNTKKT